MGLFNKKSEVSERFAWKKEDLLGTGNFAEVFKATVKDSSRKYKVKAGGKEDEFPYPPHVAIKIIDKSKVEDMNDITREIEIMQMVHHENIIQLYEVFDEAKKMNLVMELVTGGELFDRIVSKGSYTEKDAANTIFTLCSALDHLHEKKIVHRDLKPENILYESPAEDAKIKVADFGLARFISGNDMMKTACGTPGYVAPEILQNKGYDSPAVDMWSTGVILYILLCGFPPFYEEELPALFDQILKARYDFPSPWWDQISADAKGLVGKLLTLDPKKRYTAKQTMADAFMKNASDVDLSSAQKALKKYNANRRLRKAALGIIAQQRLEKALAQLRVSQKDGAGGSGD